MRELLFTLLGFWLGGCAVTCAAITVGARERGLSCLHCALRMFIVAALVWPAIIWKELTDGDDDERPGPRAA